MRRSAINGSADEGSAERDQGIVMPSHPESLRASIDVAASIRAKLNQGPSAVEKSTWSPVVTDEERQILSMGMERGKPVVIAPFEPVSPAATPIPTVAAPMAKVAERRGWQVAGWLAVVVMVTGAVGTWACVNRYEVVKKKVNSVELLYRVDHWTGTVELVGNGMR